MGQAAQHLAAAPSKELFAHLQSQSQRLAGRVGFVWLDGHGAAETPQVDLEGRPGVLGRADRFVETQPRYVPLARRLLGRTWIVETLAHALELSRAAGRGLNFVTLSGDLLEADGTLVVGPRQAAAGLISRRSQLRALKGQLTELEGRIAQAEAAVAGVEERIARCREEHQRRTDEFRRAGRGGRAPLEDFHGRGAARQFDQQRTGLDEELQAAMREHQSAVLRLEEAREKRRRLDANLAETEHALAGLGEQIAALDAQRQASNRETTEAKVELAKSEERLRRLHARLRQIEDGRQERNRALADGEEQLTQCILRAEACRWNILRAESDIAELYIRKEAFAGETVQHVDRREALQRQRSELAAESQKIRGKIRKLEDAFTPRTWRPTNFATSGPRSSSGCARITASNWPTPSTSPSISRSTSGRRCRRKSTTCGRRSTPSAA